MYGVAGSEAARAQPFGRAHTARVLELSRLHLHDDAPANSESWILAQTLHALHRARPDLWGVISFADPAAPGGHHGTVYRATNALFYGFTKSGVAYRDSSGALHSARQGKLTLTRAAAAARGWTAERRPPKYRYLFVLGGPLQRARRRRAVIAPLAPYPGAALAPRQLVLPFYRRLIAALRGLARPPRAPAGAGF
jgi:hypothetical protein